MKTLTIVLISVASTVGAMGFAARDAVLIDASVYQEVTEHLREACAHEASVESEDTSWCRLAGRVDP